MMGMLWQQPWVLVIKTSPLVYQSSVLAGAVVVGGTQPMRFLYWSRNQFLHGNTVTATTLRHRRSRSYASLTLVAPVLFNAALISTLNTLGVVGGPKDFEKLTLKNVGEYMKNRKELDLVEAGLSAAGKA